MQHVFFVQAIYVFMFLRVLYYEILSNIFRFLGFEEVKAFFGSCGVYPSVAE